MLLAQNRSLDEAKEQLEILRNRLANNKGDQHAAYERSISYGIIPVGSDNTLLASDLLNAADEKMYEYKRAYKKRHRSKQGDF